VLPVERLVASQGPGAAKNKEAQAAVKALEASITAYFANLVAIPVPMDAEQQEGNGAPVVAQSFEYTSQTHQGVLEIVTSSLSVSVARVDVAASGVTNESVADAAVGAMFAKRNNVIGWLSNVPVVALSEAYESEAVSTSPILVENNNENSIDHGASTETPLSFSKQVENLEEDKKDILKLKAEKVTPYLICDFITLK
jgi:hypothetical protein